MTHTTSIIKTKCNAKKLGIDDFQEEDEAMIVELNKLLQEAETDMTIFFRLLSHIQEPKIALLNDAFYQSNNVLEEDWNNWLSKWWSRVELVNLTGKQCYLLIPNMCLETGWHN